VTSIKKEIAPACFIAPSSIWAVLQAVLERQHPKLSDIMIFQFRAPLLAGICKYFMENGVTIEVKKRIMALLKHIYCTAQLCYNPKDDARYVNPISEDDQANNTTTQQGTANDSWLNELMNTGAFFPQRPIVRKTHTVSINGESLATCNKHYQRERKKGAGVLVFWCGTHRRCIGFYVLPSAESPQHVYSILCTRFITLPKVVIYDNACNLAEYVYNRAPLLFKDVLFVSDAFHQKNHIACARTFDPQIYPQLEALNTVLHEQKNDNLAKLKHTCRRMNYRSFVLMLRHFLVVLDVQQKNRNLKNII
jgi:hypothetical protein